MAEICVYVTSVVLKQTLKSAWRNIQWSNMKIKMMENDMGVTCVVMKQKQLKA